MARIHMGWPIDVSRQSRRYSKSLNEPLPILVDRILRSLDALLEAFLFLRLLDPGLYLILPFLTLGILDHLLGLLYVVLNAFEGGFLDGR